VHRFFVERNQIKEKQIHIIGTDVNHIKNVLRMKPQDEIVISDGEDQEYTCYIEAISGDEVLAHIMYVQETGLELKSPIYLFQGLPKSDKMDLIIQKAVELGAYEIIPVAMKRSVTKLDAKKEAAKIKRWQGISESAAKQSKRMRIPEIKGVMSFPQAISYAKSLDICLMPYELAKGMKETKETLAGIVPGQSIGIFIGPEGGFAEEEAAEALANEVRIITLGRRILRTETAGLTTLSILMYLMEDG